MLIEYHIKLVTPDGSTMLDQFVSSGTTLVVAKNLGYPAIGIDQDVDYIEVSRA